MAPHSAVVDVTPLPFGQIAQPQRADGVRLQIEHGMAEDLGRATDLTVAPFPRTSSSRVAPRS